MSNNQPQLSCGAGVPNFTNQLSDSDMFMENTTYVDDMYMKYIYINFHNIICLHNGHLNYYELLY